MPVVLQMPARDRDTCPPIFPALYQCRHMGCEEVSQLESDHWHLTLVINQNSCLAAKLAVAELPHMCVPLLFVRICDLAYPDVGTL